MISVRINDKYIKDYVARQARRQGKSRQAIVREMLRKQIEDAEDYQAAIEAKRRLDSGESIAISSEEMWNRLGLAD